VQEPRPTRPTIGCLTEDLGIARLPPLSQPLSAVDHPLIRKVQATFQRTTLPSARILAVDDRVFLKAKIERWRGAVWRQLPEQWLCAASQREEGSRDDFYAHLADRCRAWRREYNAAHSQALTTDTYSDALLPGELDRKRLAAEQATARVAAFELHVPSLVQEALQAPGTEKQRDIGGFALGVYVERQGLDAIYIAIRIRGPIDARQYAVILAEVPGTDLQCWQIHALPHRDVRPGEIVWSNVMDAATADMLAGRTLARSVARPTMSHNLPMPWSCMIEFL
jgi:hypothetical protein